MHARRALRASCDETGEVVPDHRTPIRGDAQGRVSSHSGTAVLAGGDGPEGRSLSPRPDGKGGQSTAAGPTGPRIGSACSGYGGLEMGLAAVVGGSVAWHVEHDKHPSAVLAARFPGVPNYGDVKTTDWTAVEPIDWFTAGYPCQPFSGAGLRLGEADERHLWPYVADAIRVLRPRRVLLENVAGHLSLGFGSVLGDLAALGYDVRWVCLRAADAGAPHNRARVFIVASHASRERHGSREDGRSLGRVDREDAGEARERERSWTVAGDRGAATPTDPNDDAAGNGRESRHAGPSWTEPAQRGRVAADPNGGRRLEPDSGQRRVPEPDEDGHIAADAQRSERARERASAGSSGGPDGSYQTWGVYAPAIARWAAVIGRPAPAPTVDGRLNQRFVEWMQGLPDGWVTDILPRNPALKALGNGVVPQQAALAVADLLNVRSVAA